MTWSVYAQVIAGGIGPTARSAGAAQNVSRERVLVDRVVDRLPHHHIVERRALGVESHPPDMRTRLRQEDRAGIALYLVDVVGRHVENDVYSTGEKLGDPGLLVDQRTEDHLRQRGRSIPVVWIRGQRDPHVMIPLHEFEGPRADWILGEPLAVVLHGRGTDDASGVQRECID